MRAAAALAGTGRVLGDLVDRAAVRDPVRGAPFTPQHRRPSRRGTPGRRRARLAGCRPPSAADESRWGPSRAVISACRSSDGWGPGGIATETVVRRDSESCCRVSDMAPTREGNPEMAEGDVEVHPQWG